ncbi:MAG: sortase [Chloroflexi bacterium]|nr:sortase [Chloroflexota bacterium]
MTLESTDRRKTRSRTPLLTLTAYAVALIGIVLIVGSGIYLYARARSGSDSARFSYSVPDEVVPGLLGTSAEAATRSRHQPIGGTEPVPLELKSPDVAKFANLYPGEHLNPKYWSEPEWAGSDPYGGPMIPDDFTPVLSTNIFQSFDPVATAIRMKIPAINVDSSVAELGIIDLGDQREYETPNNTIGHIPSTATPGQQGSGWFFAHLESYVAREGNIFRHLPEITDLVKQDPVDVYIETIDAEYIYRVTGTSQIHQDELRLSSASDAQITLVTCWPPRVYDQRILVDATLIAYRLL